MTTAHRPTFDPARGKEALRGPAYHQRLLPAYTQLKFRQSGQGGDADREVRDLRAELLAAEATHFAKIKGDLAGAGEDESASASATQPKLLGGAASGDGDTVMEDSESKLVQILEETRDMDADDSDEAGDGSDGSDDGGGSDDSDDDSSDDDDDAELQRELDRIRRERTEKREKEERERAAAEEEVRERDIALGNPLLNKTDFSIKRRWDDDVVFKNQARGTEDKGKKKEFVNDLLRSDFHRRFMGKYVR
ncbi:Pre-mRNA-splicing factor Cwf15/Cwc15 [Lasiosphaeria miniovina]|uniref:Pre-mRNA-splicing factor Cwf15/Cwc15 n=1 Tax=Lasiosphaeria miniovina TaxID=1954250 RepID=A0AA40E3L0_9PEZI|nr:Pre-mRNA-splicing factor Cwf15/Cwc15 [Lasiosphaeria miniovina]KAK0722811.1 Pre-mRNA-splicing factor Cwf15/Cwc15 [Lasiosphaeria miniovina]